jgi:hypothetical protein
VRAAFGEEANYLLVEALIEGGVVVSPLSKYIHLNIRICRPHNLRKDHLQRIFEEVISQLGHEYDLQNVFDLARYFLPVSIVPRRFRRKALHFGSGLPTQVICSSMIAAAFDNVGFPVLPQITAQSVKITAHRSWRERLFLSSNGAQSSLMRSSLDGSITAKSCGPKTKKSTTTGTWGLRPPPSILLNREWFLTRSPKPSTLLAC